MKSLCMTAALAAAILAAQAVTAKERTCHRCEEVREYNAEHHKNFEYYDEYADSFEFGKDDEDNPFIIKDKTPAPATAGITADVKEPKPASPVAERSVKGETKEWKPSPKKD